MSQGTKEVQPSTTRPFYSKKTVRTPLLHKILGVHNLGGSLTMIIYPIQRNAYGGQTPYITAYTTCGISIFFNSYEKIKDKYKFFYTNEVSTCDTFDLEPLLP